MSGGAGRQAASDRSPRLLLMWSRRLRPRDSYSFVPLELCVPEGVSCLEIRFGIAPGFCTDAAANARALETTAAEYLEGAPASLRVAVGDLIARRGLGGYYERTPNLVNLTLYNADGKYVGRWDAPDKEHAPPMFVSEACSSAGFRRVPVRPGKWQVVVEVWYVFHGPGQANLAVLGHGSPPAADMVAARPRPVPPRLSFRPRRVRLPGILYGEMHAHTTHSDGNHTLAEATERAAGLGLDFLAVTDHNTTSALGEFPANAPVTLVPGEELTTFFGHFCLYGVTHFHAWQRRGKERIRDAIDDAVAQGALASLAHPFAIGAPACVGCRFRTGAVPFGRFQILEVWSGAWSIRFPEIIGTLRLWDRLRRAGLRPVAIAARDWHSHRQEDTPSVPFPVTAVCTARRDAAGILDALRQGHVFATSGPAVEMRGEAAGVSGAIGDDLWLPPRVRGCLDVRLHMPEVTRGRIRVLRYGRLVLARTLPRRCEARLTLEGLPAGPYRVEVWRDNGELLLLTNHITFRK